MKKTFLLCFIIAIVVSTNIVSAEILTGEAKISGYKDGQFAVVGDIATQLEQRVAQPLSKKITEIEKGQLKVTVIGFADKTGTSAKNERLAKDRAEEAKSFLISAGLKEKEITTLTKGDEANVKMVIVQWKINPTPLKSGDDKKNSSNIKSDTGVFTTYFVVLMICLILIVLAILMINKFFDHNVGKKNETVEVSDGIKTYLVPLKKETNNKKLYSPVCLLNDPNGFIHGDTSADVKRYLTKSLKNNPGFYVPVFEELVQKKIIRKKGNVWL
jgi:hypothetical protein